jgi:WD40 repeat protein
VVAVSLKKKTSRGAPAARFSTLAFDTPGERLAWSTGGEGLRVWDLGSPPEAPSLHLLRGDIAYGRQLAFSPDGRWLAGGGLGQADFWPLAFPHANVLRAHTEGPVARLVFSPDSRYLVSCARDGARVWPLSPDLGHQRLVEVGGDYMCYDAGIDPAGHDIVVASPFMGIYRVPIEGGAARKIVDLTGRRLALSAVAFHPSKPLLAVGSTYAAPSEKLSLFVVDVVSGKWRALPARDEPSADPYAGNIEDATFAADGSLLTAGDGGIKRWDLESGKSTTFLGGVGRWAALAASGDGRRVAAVVGRQDGEFVSVIDAEIILFDMETGTRRSLPTHGARLTHAVALDATGERLVTGDASGAVSVRGATGQEPHLLLGHDGPVTDVAIASDGRWVVSASGAEIRLWPMPDVSKPPLHTLPYAELMVKLRALTNLQVVEDRASATGYKLQVGPFPGWKDVPTC